MRLVSGAAFFYRGEFKVLAQVWESWTKESGVKNSSFPDQKPFGKSDGVLWAILG